MKVKIEYEKKKKFFFFTKTNFVIQVFHDFDTEMPDLNDVDIQVNYNTSINNI